MCGCLIGVSPQHIAGERHFFGSFREDHRPHVAPEFFDWQVRSKSHAVEDLQAAVGRLLTFAVAKIFAELRVPTNILAGVVFRRSAVDQRSDCPQVRIDVYHRPLDRLPAGYVRWVPISADAPSP